MKTLKQIMLDKYYYSDNETKEPVIHTNNAISAVKEWLQQHKEELRQKRNVTPRNIKIQMINELLAEFPQG